MTDARKDGIVPDPSQLAEMQATDARLDRLGRRDPHPDDLADPLFAALAGLVDEVDVADPQQQDAAVARLLEVLDGRPLWVLDGEELSELDAARNMILLDDPTWDKRRRQVIDLRRDEPRKAAAAEGAAAASEGDAVAEVAEPDGAEGDDADEAPAAGEVAATAAEESARRPAAETADETADGADGAAADDTVEPDETDETPVAASVATTTERPVAARAGTVTPLHDPRRAPRPARPQRPSGEEPWVRAMRRVSLPAAAAITLFTLGGGVTAAVTGDPMAPLSGVSRVVDSLAGSNSGTTYSSLQENLDRARSALASGDVDQAKSLVESTRSGLDDVPQDEATLLREQIEDVQQQIARTPPNTPAPAPVTSATKPPASQPTPSAPQPSVTKDPSPTQSTPPSTPEPSDTEPASTPSPSESQPADQPTVQLSIGVGGSATNDSGD
jgi:hypothetical protein